MRCENCGDYSSRTDGPCNGCGAGLKNPRLPVKRSSAYPTVWQQAAPVLARGAALVALGVVAEAALSSLAKRALRLPTLRSPAKSRALAARRNGELPEGAYAVSETFIMRRLVFRR